MKVGLVARADDTGLGNQSAEFARNMRPTKTLIVDLCGMSASGKDLALHPEWFEGPVISTGFPTDDLVEQFVEGLDVVFAMETPYNPNLFKIARARGVRSVLQYNWEFLSYLQAGPWLDQVPDVLASPSEWHFEEAVERFSSVAEVIRLPVPIAGDRLLNDGVIPVVANRFLHVVGHSAVNDRNGTRDLLLALEHLTTPVTVTIRSQSPGAVSEMIMGLKDLNGWQKAPGVTLRIDSGTLGDYWDLYRDQDVLVMPRRYGGLCLPVNEALGALMPSIMPDISPNNARLPKDWLVPARHLDSFLAKSPIDVYEVSPRDLAGKIDEFATDASRYQQAVCDAAIMRFERTWDALKPLYEEVLSG